MARRPKNGRPRVASLGGDNPNGGPRIIDGNNDGVDDRLYRWHAEISRMIGYKPHITDTKRSYARQQNYFLSGYGANPNSAEGAPHVEGRAMDIRTRDSRLSPGDWTAIARQAAKNIGLKDFDVIHHNGTGVHLHLAVGRSGPHTPDGCPGCADTGTKFAKAGFDATKAPLPRSKPDLSAPDGTHAGEPGTATDVASVTPAATRPIATLTEPSGGRAAAYAAHDRISSAFSIFDSVRNPPPANRVPHPGPQRLTEKIPGNGTAVDSGLVEPSSKSARRYAEIMERGGKKISLAENRLAAYGETRAALLRTLMEKGGEDIRLADLKSVRRWGKDKDEPKKVVDDFIRENGLNRTAAYAMITQSARVLDRKEEGVNGKTTLGELFKGLQSAEEKRLGLTVADAGGGTANPEEKTSPAAKRRDPGFHAGA